MMMVVVSVVVVVVVMIVMNYGFIGFSYSGLKICKRKILFGLYVFTTYTSS